MTLESADFDIHFISENISSIQNLPETAVDDKQNGHNER